MEDLYDLISSATPKVDELSSEVENLHSTWIKAGFDHGAIVNNLYATAEYVDNEFYRKLGEVHTRPDHISVLRLQPYNGDYPRIFEELWEGMGEALHSEDRHPIYDVAKSIVEEIFPKFNAAYQDNPDRAYQELRRIVQQYVDIMQNSRLLLPRTE